MILESVITCPHCAAAKGETMPTDCRTPSAAMPAEFGFTAARGMAHIDPLLDRIEVRAALAYWKVRQGTPGHFCFTRTHLTATAKSHLGGSRWEAQ
jgi:hypothetical protein